MYGSQLKMVSMSAFFLILSFSIVNDGSILHCVSSMPAAPHLQNYVLMPIQVADKLLDKDIEKVEKVRKESYSLLKDLQENKSSYPTHLVSRTFARVVEEGAKTFFTNMKDLQTLIYPNALV